jgi:hypothetical protein
VGGTSRSASSRRAGRTGGCLRGSDDAEDGRAPEQETSQEADEQRPIQRLAYRVVTRADGVMRNLHGRSVRPSSDGFVPLCARHPELASYLRIDERS